MNEFYTKFSPFHQKFITKICALNLRLNNLRQIVGIFFQKIFKRPADGICEVNLKAVREIVQVVGHQVSEKILDVQVNCVGGALLYELEWNFWDLEFDDMDEVFEKLFVVLDRFLGVAQQRQDVPPVRE